MIYRLLAAGCAMLLLVACGARTEPLGSSPPRDARPPVRDSGPADSGPPIRDSGFEVDAAICGGDCSDGVFCNGREFCDGVTSRCQPGPIPACDDGVECTVDSCDRGTDSCTNAPVDRDEDGDGISACEGDCDDTVRTTFPGAAEVCDMVDQDCDGDVDEGALSECGDCRPGCNVVVLPEEGGWMPDSGESSGVTIAPDGSLVLNETRSESSFAWIANTVFGTLTKLDTTNGAQVAEYDSVLTGPGNGARPAGEECLTELAGGNCPSRTAIDLRGAVYVANRAFLSQGTVTKIAGEEEDCVDRNGNGRIDTSRDLDGDAIIERDVPGEFLGQADECILWTVDVGADNGVPRAVAVAADGTIWVGLNIEQRVLQLSPDDGEVLRNVNLGFTTRFGPYGAAIDSVGRLWVTEAGTGRIMSIDTETGARGRIQTAMSRDGCRGSYGIAIDSEDRVWLAGFQCPSAYRYDPDTNRWLEVRLPDSGGTRGIAADDRGFIYVGASHEFISFGVGGVTVGPEIARVTRFRADDGSDIRIFGTEADPLPGLGTVGVGLDSRRRVWLINQVSGSATMLDTDTGETREYPVGDAPYTYSDFTGFALRTFTAPNGFIRTVVEGCASGLSEWEQIRWDAEFPRNTHLEVRVRSANSRDALGDAPWFGPYRDAPVDLSLPPGPVPPGRFLEIEALLVSEDESNSPALRSLTLRYNCPV